MVRPTDGRCKHARGVAPEGFRAYDGADRTHLRLISGPFRPPRGPVRGRIDDVSDAQQHIEALLSERREFPRRTRSVLKPWSTTVPCTNGPTPTTRRSGPNRRSSLTWFRRWDTVMDWKPAVGDLVRRGVAERLLQLPRSPRRERRRRQGRLPLGGRARRHPDDHVPRAPRGRLPAGERPAVPRGGQGRPRQHLPGHGPRAPDRDARVRADRRAALGRVRRVQRRVAAGPDQRRRGEGADHGGRRLAARPGRAAEGQRRRGRARSVPRSST